MEISLFVFAFIVGVAALGLYNYLILYIIKTTDLEKSLDNYVSVIIYLILAIFIFSFQTINMAESFGAILSGTAFTYLSTFIICRKRNTYESFSKNVKICSAIFSSLTFLLLSSSVNGGF